MQSPWDIIRRPLVTEKAMRLVGENKYSFEVDRNANKTEIKQAIEAIFKV
ncbi:MAG: 50S ribosomal protein L23, partial [bacterium]